MFCATLQTSDQSLELKSLASQLNSAHKEIDAIRHHRSVLQSTVTELEALVYSVILRRRDQDSAPCDWLAVIMATLHNI